MPDDKGGKGLKLSLVGLLVGGYFLYTLALNPLYKRFVRPFPPDVRIFRNALAQGEQFEVEMQVRFPGGSRTVLGPMNLSYAEGYAKSLNTTLSVEPTLRTQYAKTQLVTTVSYKNRCTGKRETVSCRATFHEYLPEMSAERRSPVEGVVSKEARGNETDHLLTQLHVGLIVDSANHTFGLDPYIDNIYLSTNDGQTLAAGGGCYRPALACDNYWTLRRDKLPLSRLSSDATINLHFYETWVYKQEWVRHLQLMERGGGALGATPVLEDLKEMLSDNSPAYLAVLFTVNALHSLFFMLSLSSSYAFWSRLSNSAGLSPGKYYSDVLFQLIIVLYMIDNDTSLLLVLLAAVEMLMSVYVAVRVTGLSLTLRPRFPFLHLSSNARDSPTTHYERIAVRFLLKLATPFLVCYVAYSFAHRGQLRLYSFVLKTLVTMIYVVGFINMTPQVYINYRLKSVESLPWRAMSYHFLNTIVDDLFAFAIKMTTLQRISVFRDDVIFVIYLVQLWLYRKRGPAEPL